MLRGMVVLVLVWTVALVVLPLEAEAWHGSAAVIDDVSYVNTNGGVEFSVDFRISNHLGDTGTVRIGMSDGIDVVITRRNFTPIYDPAQFSDIMLYVSNTRMVAEGRFLPGTLAVVVEIVNAGGNVLARQVGTMNWLPDVRY